MDPYTVYVSKEHACMMSNLRMPHTDLALDEHNIVYTIQRYTITILYGPCLINLFEVVNLNIPKK